jgi:hypothetical protein
LFSGLEGGVTNKPAVFTVDMKGAGKGGLGLGIEGPVEAKMNCRDNRDGTCEVEYFPTKPGVYDITVNFADKPIPGETYAVYMPILCLYRWDMAKRSERWACSGQKGALACRRSQV